MIERGSGRTSGLTDWQLMDVHSMWACLQDQDTTGQWKQVAGWRKICDLALTHLGRLREYRRGLAEAWPPETNAAARAYIGELDQLIDKVQRTHDAAAANYDALAAATRAIGSTRAELKPLYDEYVTKFQQKQAYEEIVADPKAAAGSRLPATSPVTEADLERLNVRARGLMSGLSGELQQAQAMLSKPPLPVTRPGPRVDDPPVDPYVATNSVPVIPSVVPVPLTPSRQTQPARSSIASAKPLPAPAAPQIGPVLGQGPILGQAGTAPPATPALPGPTTSLPSAPSIPQTGITGQLPALPPSLPSRGLPTERPPTSEVRAGSVSPGPSPRSNFPNGLIGNPPAVSQPGATTPRRVNPIGSVIGGGGAGTAPTGSAGSRPRSSRGPHFIPNGPSQIGGTTGPHIGDASGDPRNRLGHQEKQDGGGRNWDPDNPWEVDRGVEPVVRPPEDRGPSDPGPAIGFDR